MRNGRELWAVPEKRLSPRSIGVNTVRTYRAALSYSSNNGMARSFMFLGTARTSAIRGDERTGFDWYKMDDVLRSGIWTRYIFLHSLGFVMWAGTKGYWLNNNHKSDP